ncbi:hypothetical protein BC830DRAFT_217145 [Chytriomyces sp. MP71]|nr:hypothetical protein BC830DRAFT_217145 [Chytriomyces sp. MP71]
MKSPPTQALREGSLDSLSLSSLLALQTELTAAISRRNVVSNLAAEVLHAVLALVLASDAASVARLACVCRSWNEHVVNDGALLSGVAMRVVSRLYSHKAHGAAAPHLSGLARNEALSAARSHLSDIMSVYRNWHRLRPAAMGSVQHLRMTHAAIPQRLRLSACLSPSSQDSLIIGSVQDDRKVLVTFVSFLGQSPITTFEWVAQLDQNEALVSVLLVRQSLVAVGTYGRSVIVFDTATGTRLGGHSTHPGAVTNLCNDGDNVVSVGVDGSMAVYSVQERRVLACYDLHTLPDAHNIHVLAVNSTTKFLSVLGNNNTIHIFSRSKDAISLPYTYSHSVHTQHPPTAVSSMWRDIQPCDLSTSLIYRGKPMGRIILDIGAYGTKWSNTFLGIGDGIDLWSHDVSVQTMDESLISKIEKECGTCLARISSCVVGSRFLIFRGARGIFIMKF